MQFHSFIHSASHLGLQQFY